jgi:hypothetical protein
MALAAGQIVNYDDIATVAILARGNRTSNKTLVLTETGYLRVDNCALVGGHAYMVICANVRLNVTTLGAATDHYKIALRYDDTGVAATTASTEVGRAETSADSTAADNSFPPIIGFVFPTVDVLGSFILTANFTNNAPTTALQADTPGINLVVVDLGETVTDTGVDI